MHRLRSISSLPLQDIRKEGSENISPSSLTPKKNETEERTNKQVTLINALVSPRMSKELKSSLGKKRSSGELPKGTEVSPRKRFNLSVKKERSEAVDDCSFSDSESSKILYRKTSVKFDSPLIINNEEKRRNKIRNEDRKIENADIIQPNSPLIVNRGVPERQNSESTLTQKSQFSKNGLLQRSISISPRKLMPKASFSQQGLHPEYNISIPLPENAHVDPINPQAKDLVDFIKGTEDFLPQLFTKIDAFSNYHKVVVSVLETFQSELEISKRNHAVPEQNSNLSLALESKFNDMLKALLSNEQTVPIVYAYLTKNEKFGLEFLSKQPWYQNKPLDVIDPLLTYYVKTKMDKSTLFRNSSIVTKMITLYLKEELKDLIDLLRMWWRNVEGPQEEANVMSRYYKIIYAYEIKTSGPKSLFDRIVTLIKSRFEEERNKKEDERGEGPDSMQYALAAVTQIFCFKFLGEVNLELTFDDNKDLKTDHKKVSEQDPDKNRNFVPKAEKIKDGIKNKFFGKNGKNQTIENKDVIQKTKNYNPYNYKMQILRQITDGGNGLHSVFLEKNVENSGQMGCLKELVKDLFDDHSEFIHKLITKEVM